MEIALIENEYILPDLVYKHDWTHILYIIVSSLFFLIEVCQRISLDIFYSSKDAHVTYVPSLNRYPTELTPPSWSISYLWYLVFIWQCVWMIYSIMGIFRRTSSGYYFYQQPCAMNKWCFFYTAFGLILYTPQLAAASRNKYGIGISIFRHVGTLCEIIIIVVVVHISLWENLKNYLRDQLFADVWLTRLFYHNGLALWASVLFYESCLSIIIGLIYSDWISPPVANTIGCLILLIGLISLSFLENFLFYHSLAFTFSHWLTFPWLIGNILIHGNQSSSRFLMLIVRLIFVLSIVLFCLRLCLFFYRYMKKTIPTFQTPRIHTFVLQPRPF